MSKSRDSCSTEGIMHLSRPKSQALHAVCHLLAPLGWRRRSCDAMESTHARAENRVLAENSDPSAGSRGVVASRRAGVLLDRKALSLEPTGSRRLEILGADGSFPPSGLARRSLAARRKAMLSRM